MRIAIGGIQTECSTYSRIRTHAEDFRVLRGAQIPKDGYFEFTREFAVDFAPVFFARAVPGGPIDGEAYRQFKAEFVERLAAAGRVDGLYLAMHGAMFVEGMEDAEGDWIEAARATVGRDCLISASYDLHGNLSRRVIDRLDMLTAYRTAPHIDVEATMRKALTMLVDCLAGQTRPAMAWLPIPVLMPGERSSTEDEPAKSLYGELPRGDAREGVLDASLLVGYVWADEPRATASAVVTGFDKGVLEEEALRLGRAYWDAREQFSFGVKVGTLRECIDWAQAANTQPVILADSGDNPTGGGVGDRAEVLDLLLAAQFEGALIAGIADPPATLACFAAGVGQTISLSIGAALDPLGSVPVRCRAKVVRVVEEEAVVEIEGITLVLTARRRPFHELRDFERLGLDPQAVKLLVVKSGYLSPELAPLANPNLMALSEGAINQDIEGLPKNRRRPPTYPFDRTFTWQPRVYFSE